MSNLAAEPMRELTDILEYEFNDLELARVALTHRSAVGRGEATYERLEFLGDRVLALVISDLLYEHYPREEEGALAKRLVALVRRETLTEIALKLGLGPLITLSKGEEDAGGRENPAILADVCEALIGAIHRDGGLDSARRFIERHWRDLMTAEKTPPKDAKTSLQEWAQGKGYNLPEYRTVDRSGPDHAPCFTIEVSVANFPPERGQGATKRIAEQAAAELLLSRLGVSNG
ncbi:MAG: ribonuclease III [Alphaproteobacteria bacterium]|nr:ribonuclease III [Alphaproteobacteria bacterium]